LHADRHLRRLFVSVGDLELCGSKAPCPGCPDDCAVLCGDEPEIARSLPANEIFGDARHGLRRLCIGFIGCYREKMPQYLKVILDSRTDHKIGHRTRLSFGLRLRCRLCLGEPAQLLSNRPLSSSHASWRAVSRKRSAWLVLRAVMWFVLRGCDVFVWLTRR